MTMGPPQAEEALRECLALGADRAIHLSDRVFAVADTIGTSRTLALAVRKEGADLVLCGRKTLDSETWQVPPQVAAFLGWPHVTNVVGDRALRGHAAPDARDRLRRGGVRGAAAAGRLRRADAGENRRQEIHRGRSRSGRRPTSSTTCGRTTSASARPARRRGCWPSATSRPERAGIRAASAEEAAARIRELLAERAPEPPSWEKPGHIGDEPGASYDCWSVCRARRRPAPPSLARADRPEPRPRGQARRTRRRAAHRPGPRGRCARGRAHTGRRSSMQWTTRRSRSTTPSSGRRSSARILVEHEPRARPVSRRPGVAATTGLARRASSSSG